MLRFLSVISWAIGAATICAAQAPSCRADAFAQPASGLPQGYLASIIPTPGLQSSNGGTAAVRNASDASLTASKGAGEGLNQAVPASPRASQGAPSNQVMYFLTATGKLAVTSLSGPAPLQGAVNLVCGSTPISPSASSSSANPSAFPGSISGQAASLSGIASASIGSESIDIVTLNDGRRVSAWTPIASTVLHTEILSADLTTLTEGPQYPVGPNSQRVVFADFNADGNADLAVSDFGSLSTNTGGNIRIFLGKGDGTFTAGAVVNVSTPVPLYVADFNGDGKLDLAGGDVTDDVIVVLLGNGDGTFQAPLSSPVPGSPQSIVGLDFNGDGLIDLAESNFAGGVTVLLGKGDGTFQKPVSYDAGAGSSLYLASLDVNGDGNLDLIVNDASINALSLLFGNGDGTFQSPVRYVTGASLNNFGLVHASNGTLLITFDNVGGGNVIVPITSGGVAGTPRLYAVPHPATGIADADLNGDKLPDMVAADGVVSVLLRSPGSGFQNAVNYSLPSGSQAVAVAVGDVNGDGKNDVVAASMLTTSNGSFGGTVNVLLGNGDGTLGSQNSYPLGGYPGGAFDSAASGIVLADFNGDGKPDIAAGLQPPPGVSGGGGVSILLNDGTGTMRPAIVTSVGNSIVTGLASGDFNGDGKLDIIAGLNNNLTTPGAVVMLLGKGDGTFQASPPIAVGSPAGTPMAIAAGDLNGDGKLDLVVALENFDAESSLVVLLGNGDGSFRQSSPMDIGGASGSTIAILDLNGDGVSDLAVGDCCGLTESVYFLGKGDGTFGDVRFFTSGASVRAFAVADWNNDGVAGLAIAQETSTVTAMQSGLNQKVATAGSHPLSEVSSAAFGGGTLAPGSLASAYGTDLANGAPAAPPLPWPAVVGGTSVGIADSAGMYTAAPLTYASTGQVNFDIPDKVAVGPATVTVTSGDGTASSQQITLNPVAPSLFVLNSANLAAAVAVCVSASGAQTTEYPYQIVNGAIVANPLNLGACSETVLELFATGMDAVSASSVQATVGGKPAMVLYAGPQGAFPGLDQVNVVIPQSLAGSGSVSVMVITGGQTSNNVSITVQ